MSSEFPHCCPNHPPATCVRSRHRSRRQHGGSKGSRRAYVLVPVLFLLLGPAGHAQGVCVHSQFVVDALSGKVVSQLKKGETAIAQASVELLEDRYQGRVLAQTTSAPDGTLPAGFSYPEQETIQLDFVIEAKSLLGVINGPDGHPLAEVLVEILNPNWQDRIEAEFTDAKGRFAFEPGYSGIIFLQLSKPGFSTMLLKVNVSEQATEDLELELHLGR